MDITVHVDFDEKGFRSEFERSIANGYAEVIRDELRACVCPAHHQSVKVTLQKVGEEYRAEIDACCEQNKARAEKILSEMGTG